MTNCLGGTYFCWCVYMVFSWWFSLWWKYLSSKLCAHHQANWSWPRELCFYSSRLLHWFTMEFQIDLWPFLVTTLDLHLGDFILENEGLCSSLCPRGGYCCHPEATCRCGTTTGQYECICPQGYHGSGLVDGCHRKFKFCVSAHNRVTTFHILIFFDCTIKHERGMLSSQSACGAQHKGTTMYALTTSLRTK